jgi:hypothetical protein
MPLKSLVQAPRESIYAGAIHPATRIRFRRDIEGLRALAILVVIFYHTHTPGFEAAEQSWRAGTPRTIAVLRHAGIQVALLKRDTTAWIQRAHMPALEPVAGRSPHPMRFPPSNG